MDVVWRMAGCGRWLDVVWIMDGWMDSCGLENGWMMGGCGLDNG